MARRRANITIVDEDEGESISPESLGLTEVELTPSYSEPEPEELEPPIELETALEAEEILESEEPSAQIFQSYELEEEEPLVVEDTTSQPENVPEDSPNKDIVLLDYFPTTPEEYQKGFKRLSVKEKKVWGVTSSEDEYDTLPGMAALLGVVRNTVQTWLFECVSFFPSGFLNTRKGLTAECLIVLRLYRDYCGGDNYTKSKKTRFLRKLEEQFEQYKEHIRYWENRSNEQEEQSKDTERSTALTHVPAIDGEFVDPEEQLQIQISFERSDRATQSGLENHISSKVLSAISGAYKNAAKFKPLMDQAIQSGLTGGDLPDLSQVIKQDN